MDAMLCQMALHCDDQDSADEWYRTKAPRDPMHLNVMKRYQYLTQAMVEIEQNRPDAALLTLSPLERYIQGCGRHIDGIHLNILCALALYRKKDNAWRARLTAALDTAAEYSFITPVSVYSAAVLPLLEKLNRNDDTKWYKRLMAAVRTPGDLLSALSCPAHEGGGGAYPYGITDTTLDLRGPKAMPRSRRSWT